MSYNIAVPTLTGVKPLNDVRTLRYESEYDITARQGEMDVSPVHEQTHAFTIEMTGGPLQRDYPPVLQLRGNTFTWADYEAKDFTVRFYRFGEL